MMTIARLNDLSCIDAEVAKAMLLAAWEKGDARMDMEQIFEKAKDGYNQVWCAYDGSLILGCILTELQKRPNGHKICLIYLGAGGRLEEWWQPMMRVVSRWAESQEADQFELVGRPGWQRWCKRLVPSAKLVKVHMAAPLESFL